MKHTVLGTVCQAPGNRPFLSYGTKPPGLSVAHWQDLQTNVHQGHYIRSKGFGLLWLVVACVTLVVFLQATTENSSDSQTGEAKQESIALFALVVIFLSTTAAQLALEAAWHAPSIRQAVAIMQPRLQQSGWILRLTTSPSIFFMTGFNSLTATPYQTPTLPDVV